MGSKGWTVGPLSGEFLVQQNIVKAPRFDVALFGGHLRGKMFLNTHPKSLKIGIKGVMTRLDLGQILDNKKQEGGAQLGDQIVKNRSYLSGSAALELDLNRALIEGQINFTEISADQLLKFLYLVDPEYEDQRIGTIRRALSLGYPSYVEVKMRFGLMDLKVDITGVANTSLDIRGIELSKFFTSKTESLKRLLERIPVR